MATRWHFAVYRTRCCWIALANPFPNGQLLANGGRFAFGQSRSEAMSNLHTEVLA